MSTVDALKNYVMCTNATAGLHLVCMLAEKILKCEVGTSQEKHPKC